MPGIFFAIANDGTPLDSAWLEKGLKRLASFSGTAQTASASPGLFVGLHCVGLLGHSHARRNALECWAYGLVLPMESRQAGGETCSSAEHALQAYEKHGLGFSQHLQGEFQVVLRDGETVLAANDRFGLRPWYACKQAGCLILSPAVKGLLPLLPGAPELDPVSVAGFFTFNKIRLGNRTMVKGVEVWPPASLLVKTKGKPVSQRSTWTFQYNDSMSEEPASDSVIDALVVAYREAMRRHAAVQAGRRVGISLSGGLDSRSMVGALAPDEAKRFSAHTYGLSGSDEVLLAGQVASTAGMPHFFYPMEADDFIRHADVTADVSDEMDLFVQGAQHLWLVPAAASGDVMMTGLDLDVTLGGIYLTPDVLGARNDVEVLDLLRKRNRIFTEEELGLLAGPSLRNDRQAPYDFARDLIRALPQNHPAAKYDLFINQYSMRRVIFARYGQIRNYMETATPMLDYHFIDLVLKLPTRQRAGHATFQPFLNRLCPELCRIPYQRTTLPPCVPVRFWADAVRIEQEREQLYYRIWRETHGEIRVPYRRYYTNFDEWLRESPAWISFADQRLLDPAARIYGMGIAEPQAVRRFVEEHRQGQVSRRQQIVCLLSLEAYLRRFFDAHE